MPNETPNSAPTHDPATLDTFERQLVANGHTPEAAKARVDQFRVSAPAKALPSKSAAPFSADSAGVSAEQIERAVSGQLAYRGTLTAKLADQSISANERAQADASLKQVDAFLKSAGHDPVNPPIDTRTEGERQFDDAGFNASADVNQYDLRGVFSRPDLEGVNVPELDATMRSALVELGVPPILGKVVVEAALDGQRDWSRLRTDTDRQEHHMNHQRIVSRALGVPYEKAVEIVKPIVAKLSPANREYLARSGALESPAVWVALYQSSQLPAARKSLGGGNG